ncbi:hypothetical protein BV394_05925 [Brevirhabdus pacifica]|uniref:Uncharacterized protein n=1 Tax=Brevirhabdus pacifica TaxID=1267768 RepID=A0A1U7DLU5_9RHOB|nr:VCBS repeat-containing protein [Brevirhabdus pacifica]APX90997.1 hypothetical protein BV394_05925 [Brevirhabdus pacifica]OWU76913.1 hypothetical protein ATO5_10360 [Loktanella sp. 22II-4b]PJJ86069.1 VCBS repeat protein [Brevirhabdus pacifica]
MLPALLGAVLLGAPGAGESAPRVISNPVEPTVTAARYEEPTTRYTHGILGDDEEWGALVLEMSDGTARRIRLPQERVFEDVAPRLADLDGDGAPEVIVVETEVTLGAQLAVYGAEGKIAATPHIGRSNRWLSPIGAADLDGDGHVEIAYVDRPHLAKIVMIWRYQHQALTRVAIREDFTNHRIGDAEIWGGIRQCGDQPPEMIVADAGWRNLHALRFDGQKVTDRRLGPLKQTGDFKAAMTCP